MARKRDATAYDKYKDKLNNTDLGLLNNMNVNGGFSEFSSIIENTRDTIALTCSRTFTISYKNIIRYPWVTKGILKSSRTLDKLHKKIKAPTRLNIIHKI